jgi:hypothetical protein
MKHFSEASKVLEGQRMFQILTRARQMKLSGRGSFFGKYGEGHVRFCFANSMDNI